MAHPVVSAAVAAGLIGVGMPVGEPYRWQPQTELDCKPYVEMLADLKDRYGQVPVSGGALHDSSEPDAGGMVIVATPRGDSWTLVVLTNDGHNACAGAWGHDWQQSSVGRRMPPSLPPDGKPRMD